MTKISNYTILLLPIVAFVIVASPSIANSAFAINYNSNYPVTETNSTGYAFLKDPSTGISVTLSNADSSASFGIIDQKLTSPSNGERTVNLINPEYYGVALLGVTTGNANICTPYVNSNPNVTMQYWFDNNWSKFSNISVGNNMVCGSVSVIPFTSFVWTNAYTDVSVGVQPQ